MAEMNSKTFWCHLDSVTVETLDLQLPLVQFRADLGLKIGDLAFQYRRMMHPDRLIVLGWKIALINYS